MARIIKGRFYCYECGEIDSIERYEDEYGRGFDLCCICQHTV